MARPDPLLPVVEALGREGRPSSDFDLNRDVSLPPGRILRPAAVLVPLLMVETEVRVVLTKRSSALKHHPGQIAFPGGKVDAIDADDAAVPRAGCDALAIGREPDRGHALFVCRYALE